MAAVGVDGLQATGSNWWPGWPLFLIIKSCRKAELRRRMRTIICLLTLS